MASKPNYTRQLNKDYTDDWEQFKAGLTKRTLTDLHQYARNLVVSSGRIEGNDDYANSLYDKLTHRASLVLAEIRSRPAVPVTTLIDRKRRVDELTAQLDQLAPPATPPPSDGARFDDPPIPTRITPLVVNAPPRPASPDPLECEEEVDDDEDTEPLSPYKRFKVDFEQEENKE